MTNDNRPGDERVKSVRAACGRAPDGPGRDAALKHCEAAETARLANDKAATSRHLEAAARALA